MAKIVVTGAGMNGLTTAMLLAGDGHEVTVLERDPAPPPISNVAWEQWERRGVAQFRQLHYLHQRWRHLAEAELPGLVDALEEAGAIRFNPVDLFAAAGGREPGDEVFDVVTARRPVLESVVASAAAATTGLTIRRGAAVAQLLALHRSVGEAPRVTGVVTESGEQIDADLVVDATGRRSGLPRMLDALGASPLHTEIEPAGFVYFTRHFRSSDGTVPDQRAPLLAHYDSFSVLTLPADNGTWGVGITASSEDPALRAAQDLDVWERILHRCASVAHWIDAEPITDGVALMAKLEDRRHEFVVDGEPVVTGVVAVGDSWACTNPSIGRGITIGLLHSLALRDVIRQVPLDQPRELAVAFQAATLASATPWYEATLGFDRHRLAEIRAQVAGEPYAPEDPTWEITRALMHASLLDPELFRGMHEVIGMLALPQDVLGRPGVFERVIELGAGWRDAPPDGPDRQELVALTAVRA